MRSSRSLLVVSALVEVGAGLGLLAAPVLVVSLLLGEASGASSPAVLARIAGAALLALAAACWLNRTQEAAATRGIRVAMAIYDLLAMVLLAQHGAWHAAGVGLWPAVIVHGGLALWCITSLARDAHP